MTFSLQKTNLFLILFFSSIIFCNSSSLVFSHPHLFTMTRYSLVFDDKGLTGVKVFWQFDEMYSITTVDSFDENGDGIFNPEEAEELAKLGVENLKNFNYFTHIEIEKEKFPVRSVRNMKVNYKKNQLLYSFFIPCLIPIENEKKTIKISPYDPEFFAAMFFSEEQPVLFENREQFEIESKIIDDPETLIYFDTIHPLALLVSIRRK